MGSVKRKDLEKAEADIKYAIKWIFVEYNYLSGFKFPMAELLRYRHPHGGKVLNADEIVLSKEEEAYKTAVRALRYLGECNKRTKNNVENIIRDLRIAVAQNHELTKLERKVEITYNQLLEAFSIYSTEFRGNLSRIVKNIKKKKQLLKAGQQQAVKKAETEICRIARDTEKHVDVLRVWIKYLEKTLERVETEIETEAKKIHNVIVKDPRLKRMLIRIEQGEDINILDHGWTALMIASAKDYPGIVKTLLEHHANPDIQDDRGYTALILAAWGRKVIIVRILLEYGANRELRCDSGTALELAEEKGDPNVIREFER